MFYFIWLYYVPEDLKCYFCSRLLLYNILQPELYWRIKEWDDFRIQYKIFYVPWQWIRIVFTKCDHRTDLGQSNRHKWDSLEHISEFPGIKVATTKAKYDRQMNKVVFYCWRHKKATHGDSRFNGVNSTSCMKLASPSPSERTGVKE